MAAGGVRVELSIERDSAPPQLLQHGLPGDVEVAVERVAPAALVLRAAGQLVVRPIVADGTLP